MPDLDKRVAVITGAGRGIGREHALLHRMSEDEWDAVLHVHLKRHFSPLRHAADHWRARSKAG